MSEHKSPARASGSNPPPAIIAGEEIKPGFVRIGDDGKAYRAGLEHTECDGTPLSEMGRILDLEAKLKSLELRFDMHCGVAGAAASKQSKYVTFDELDRLLGLHERIEVIYLVDHYEVSILTSDITVEIGTGQTIHEAFTNLTAKTKNWTLKKLREEGM